MAEAPLRSDSARELASGDWVIGNDSMALDKGQRLRKAFFDMLGVFAGFETNLRHERQGEGIAAANTARSHGLGSSLNNVSPSQTI